MNVQVGDRVELQPVRGEVVAAGDRNFVVLLDNGTYWCVLNEEENVRVLDSGQSFPPSFALGSTKP